MIVIIILLSILFLEGHWGGRSRSQRTKKSRGITSQEKNKGLLESLTKCKKKRNLAIYPVLLTSRLVSNAHLKGIMTKIKIVVTP